jgi:hypothetical protein
MGQFSNRATKSVLRILLVNFKTDPDPNFHLDVDPDPSFQIKAQNLEKSAQIGSYSKHFGCSSTN